VGGGVQLAADRCKVLRGGKQPQRANGELQVAHQQRAARREHGKHLLRVLQLLRGQLNHHHGFRHRRSSGWVLVGLAAAAATITAAFGSATFDRLFTFPLHLANPGRRVL
jgi:hypothetical protein